MSTINKTKKILSTHLNKFILSEAHRNPIKKLYSMQTFNQKKEYFQNKPNISNLPNQKLIPNLIHKL